jgi:hypothetical protein
MAQTVTVTHQIFRDRRTSSDTKLEQFANAFRDRLGDDHDRLRDDTCLYVTGSGGRGELSDHSDLDLFLIREGERPSRLDEMVLGAAVVGALRSCAFPQPSKDGEFLTLHRLSEMLQHMGTPKDDALNLFTARMLLLLESRCIEGHAFYDRAVDQVLGQYWRNLDKHPNDYLPIILLNDISRYWRIVLLNYEAKQNPRSDGATSFSEEEQAERRLRSHKLRFSRCLLCYSAIAFLLAEARTGNVTHRSVREMVKITPIERFERVGQMVDQSACFVIEDLLTQYANFLERMNVGKQELVLRFQEPSFRKECAAKGEAFGAKMAELMQQLGNENGLYRYLIV